MLVEKDITLHSFCEHHFLPIIGKVHVAYFPGKKVVGLSKLNRLVGYYAKRPQVQERLTMQIANGLKEALGTEDVAVYIEADHLCVAARGVEDTKSSTVTSFYGGRFRRVEERQAFWFAEVKPEEFHLVNCSNNMNFHFGHLFYC